MPLILSQEGPREKAAYLNSLLDEVYMVDIVERYGLRGAAGLGELVNVLCVQHRLPNKSKQDCRHVREQEEDDN